jgi:hypothetical protein
VDTSRLKRVLLSIPHAALRLGWFEDQLARWTRPEAARVLDALLKESEAADPAAREVLLTIVLLLVRDKNDGFRDAMRQEATDQRLFSLERAVRRAPPASIQAPPAEEQRVPDYGMGRELTLGERRSLARRPTRAAFDKLLRDPHPAVIRLLLANPKMVEDDAVRLATRRPAQQEIILELVRCPSWLSRRRVRMSILLNPGSPPDVSMALLGLCTRTELLEIVDSADISLVVRATARELLERRPPLSEETGRGALQ